MEHAFHMFTVVTKTMHAGMGQLHYPSRHVIAPDLV